METSCLKSKQCNSVKQNTLRNFTTIRREVLLLFLAFIMLFLSLSGTDISLAYTGRIERKLGCSDLHLGLLNTISYGDSLVLTCQVSSEHLRSKLVLRSRCRM